MFLRSTLAAVACLILVALAAADPVPVSHATGKVLKADKDSVTFQPREEGGKFGKAVTLKVTGTSRVTTLIPQTRDKKLVMTQKDTDAKDLAAGMPITVIYAAPPGQDPVLLSAVVQPDDK
jgi:hypothetical protein